MRTKMWKELVVNASAGYLVPNDQLSSHDHIGPAAVDKLGVAAAKETSIIVREYLLVFIQ
jgi:hypothetical protein